MPLLLHSRCPKPVQISGLGTGTRLSYAQISQTADSEINNQSGLLLGSLNQWYHIAMPYYFSWFMARLFTDQSVYFLYIKLSWNYKPIGVCQRGFSHYKLWENHGLTGQPAITDTYLCGRLCILFILYFKLSFSKGQKLN
jgi:hypothetical protein